MPSGPSPHRVTNGILNNVSDALRRLTRVYLFGIALIFSSAPAFACTWDTNTIRDELQTRGTSDFQLITGQFPHHGQAFYQAQLARSRGILEKQPGQLAARNDLAVALLKLGRHPESLAAFDKLLQAAPERYETLSNLGVLHKKMGRYAEAAGYISRALKIKPAGHMGLGDWYLRMLRWLDKTARSKTPPEANFLGYPYDRPLGNEDRPLDYARALIRNDRGFADGYLLLGDCLRQQRQKNLALWAYVRALDLGHPNPGILEARIDRILSYWRKSITSTSSWTKYVENRADTVAGIKAGLAQAGQWLAKFEACEAELLASAGTVDFDQVEAALKQRGVKRHEPRPHGIRRGGGSLASLLLIGLSLILLIAVAIRLWRGRSRS